MTRRSLKKASGAVLIFVGFVALLFQKSFGTKQDSHGLRALFVPESAHADTIGTSPGQQASDGGGDGGCDACPGDGDGPGGDGPGECGQ